VIFLKQTAYSRRFLRIRPDVPLYGQIRIVQVRGRHVLSNQARVRLMDLGTGGVRFASVLKLPADSDVILELSMEYEGTVYRFEGYIVSSMNTEVHEYEYCFCFMHPEAGLRQLLLKIFARHERFIIIRMSGGQAG
jgi:hypothetical protein